MKKRLYLIAAVVLLFGIGSAVFIYLTAGDDSTSGMVYEFQHSNKYRHDVELYSGKTGLVADDLIRWFDGLWQGRSLSLTVACISFFISFCIFFFARMHFRK